MKIYNLRERNKGFTLVEVIVVLIILAILAALLIPALLGYIDRAKLNDDMLDANNCMKAVQGELVELYAFETEGEEDKGGSGNNQHKASVFPDYGGRNNNGDVEMSESVYKELKKSNPDIKNYAEKIFNIADDHPYIFIVGLGNRSEYNKGDAIRASYIVYVCMYMKTADSKPIFYDGERWVTDYLGNTKKSNNDKYQVFDDKNQMLSENPKLNGMKIQYYMLADGDGKYTVADRDGSKTSVWKFLRDEAKKQ